MSYSEARKDLTALMDKVAADRLPVLIAGEDGQNVVMMSATAWADAEAMLSVTHMEGSLQRDEQSSI